MARPVTKTPRLADLDPGAVADEVVRLVREHIHTLLLRYSLGEPYTIPEHGTHLHLSTQLLVGYAQRGLVATDWPDDACALDAIQQLCESLYSCAGEPGTFGVGPLEKPDASDLLDPVRLVLVAAHARHRLACRRAGVSAVELAALAGVSDDHVRLLARQGELTLEDGIIPRADARRWLGARGVPGFGSAKAGGRA